MRRDPACRVGEHQDGTTEGKEGEMLFHRSIRSQSSRTPLMQVCIRSASEMNPAPRADSALQGTACVDPDGGGDNELKTGLNLSSMR